MIEVKHLTKKYGTLAAVEDLSFTVSDGQIYGFLGPNGAGKSTTMNIMTGFLAPSDGQVLIGGHDILEDGKEARKCIGYLPEIPPVYPEMTVEEYMDFAAGLKGITGGKKESAISRSMELTGILEVRKRLIRNLSKGFRQRVGLAQVILGDPEVLILDEPMVGLDPKQIIEIRELIKTLGEKHTIILSSHILSEISAICDHIMIIAHGKLVASDTPENLAGLMAGSGRLQLTVRGDWEEINGTLSTLKDIKEIVRKETMQEGECSLEILSEGETDVREEIFFAFAKVSLPILEMQYSRASLEDIFLELTEDSRIEKDPDKEKKKGRFSSLFKKKE